MELNSRTRNCLAALAGLALLGAMASAYLRYSPQRITLPRILIPPPHPPQPKQWSAAWNHVRSSKTILTLSALSENRVEVLRAFLKSYAEGSSGHLNVGDQTVPPEISEDDMRGCLAGLEPEPLPDASAIHRLSSAMFSSENIRLVDPKQQQALISKIDPSRTIGEGESVDGAVESAISGGLLELSEVVFAVGGGFAVMQFSFSCGGLCGQGGTLVFEKSGQVWKRSDRSCRSYVN